jgi:hypothetical protein
MSIFFGKRFEGIDRLTAIRVSLAPKKLSSRQMISTPLFAKQRGVGGEFMRFEGIDRLTAIRVSLAPKKLSSSQMISTPLFAKQRGVGGEFMSLAGGWGAKNAAGHLPQREKYSSNK